MGTWNSAFEAIPAGTAALSGGDDVIRTLKEEIRLLGAAELEWGNIGGLADNGRLQAGAARAFLQNAAPAALTSNDKGGSNTLDDGRLWVDANDSFKLYVRDQSNVSGSGTNWHQIKGAAQEVERAEIVTGTGNLTSATFTAPTSDLSWAISCFAKYEGNTGSTNFEREIRMNLLFNNNGAGANQVDESDSGDAGTGAGNDIGLTVVCGWFFAPLVATNTYVFTTEQNATRATITSGMMITRMFPYVAP